MSAYPQSQPRRRSPVPDTSLGHAIPTPIVDVRWEKILSLRTAIACGRYNISAEALAERLIDYLRGEGAQLARHGR